jgi:hypothetical protein
MHTKCWLENLKGRDYSKDQGVDGRIMSINGGKFLDKMSDY